MDEGNWQFEWVEWLPLLSYSLPGFLLAICGLFVRHRGVAFALALGALSATATQALRSILWLPLMFLMLWNADPPLDARQLALTFALSAPPIAIALLALCQLIKVGRECMQPMGTAGTRTTHQTQNRPDCA